MKGHSLIPACDLSLHAGNCTDPDRSVEVSFRACQERSTEGSASVYTYTNVTCDCSSGDVTIQVKLSNGQIADYGTLGTEPNPELLNAGRCDDKDKDSEPYSYCIKFSNLSMVEDINTSELVSEVTSALVVSSSKACLVIEFPGMFIYLTHLYHIVLYPEANTVMITPMYDECASPSTASRQTTSMSTTAPTPASGAKNGKLACIHVHIYTHSRYPYNVNICMI